MLQRISAAEVTKLTNEFKVRTQQPGCCAWIELPHRTLGGFPTWRSDVMLNNVYDIETAIQADGGWYAGCYYRPSLVKIR